MFKIVKFMAITIVQATINTVANVIFVGGVAIVAAGVYAMGYKDGTERLSNVSTNPEE